MELIVAPVLLLALVVGEYEQRCYQKTVIAVMEQCHHQQSQVRQVRKNLLNYSAASVKIAESEKDSD